MKHKEIEERLGKKVEKNKRYSEILSPEEQEIIGFWSWVETDAIDKEATRLRNDQSAKPLSEKDFAELVEEMGQELLSKHGGDYHAACASLS